MGSFRLWVLFAHCSLSFIGSFRAVLIGPRGRLTVMLTEPIMVESVSLEHAAREILLNGGISAPKDFSIVGEIHEGELRTLPREFTRW